MTSGLAMADVEATLYWSRFQRRWRARPPKNRRNNDLSPAVGLLELSNALDFAANVWNAIPPPVIARTFMALGATGALIILAFASFDWPRAWHNTTLLRQERARLLQLQKHEETAVSKGLTQSDVQTYLDLNHRELGNEIIDRLGMGLLLGFGALTVGIGTYLAIDGENPTSYLASNVITGYLGNVPAAIYGLMNAAWCVYGWRRAQRHTYAAVQNIRKLTGHNCSDDIAEAIETHSKRVKIHASINGIAGIAGGAGSLMTASAYIVPVCVWGYIILVPCVISAFTVNVYWRLRVNYHRYISEPRSVERDAILHEAALAKTRERLLADYRSSMQVRKAHQKIDENSDADLLNKFLVDWLAADMAHLTKKSDQQNEVLKTLDVGEENKEEQFKSIASDIVTDLEDIQTKIDRAKALLYRLQDIEENAEKHSTTECVVESVNEIIHAMDLFPQLCARLANKSATASLVIDRTEETGQFNVDPGPFQQRIAENNASTSLFVQAASETLLKHGIQQARNHVRYYCELCGCAFAQPSRGLIS